MKSSSTAALTLALVFAGLQSVAQETTKIISSTTADSALVKVLMKDAYYDASRDFTPFYVISKTTGYSETASPSLVIRNTRTVEEPHATVIRKTLGAHLDKDFRLTAKSSLSRNENLNQHRLVPFRIAADGRIEELTDYAITWKISQNNNRSQRSQASGFKSSSVLASGTWHKIGVTQTGIHRISKTFLGNMGFSTAPEDLRKLKIFGNGGKMLPERNGDFRIDDLEENAIQIVDGNDGSFDNLDYVLFYATGPNEWKKAKAASGLKFMAVKNLYSDTSFYFITQDVPGNGKRVAQVPSLQQGNTSTSSYDYYNFHEQDLVNLPKSGRNFFGELFDIKTSYNIGWADGNFVTGDSIVTEAIIIGSSNDSTQFLVDSKNGLKYFVTTAGIPKSDYMPYGSEKRRSYSGINGNGAELAFTISKVSARGVGWLDKLTVNARRGLLLTGKQYNFRDTRTSGPGKVCTFSIAKSSELSAVVWNVTDPLNPYVQNYSSDAAGIYFTASADSVNEYCLVSGNDYYTPSYVTRVPNQNLHALQQADYVIVTHPLFLREAQRLGAFHQQKEGFTYAVATTEQIYNEFSSGRQDISGIRDFIRMLYSRNIASGKQVKYVALMGDGSYNNRNRNLVNNSNLVPTYQSHESLTSTQSLATDDFYALMDSTEGFLAEDEGAVDIGTGRFTCRTVQEVRNVLDKIEQYYKTDPNLNLRDDNLLTSFNESNMADWRNWLLFLADDGDAALHMWQSDSLSKRVLKIAPVFNSDKIFLDAYQRFSTPGGPRYPDASDDFLRRIKKGALIFNYTGHGGEVGLTGERIIDVEIINNLDNLNRLPLFITATCEFSRYDDPGRTSAGELSLLNPKGGAIALMTTCRLAYASSNYNLNMLLLQNLFSKLPSGEYPKMGDALRMTKSAIGQSFLYANFHLLGDPAMPLAYPRNKVVTSSINNVPVTSNSSDTLSALARITVNGYVADVAGNKMSGFNGVVYPTVFDKEQKQQGLLNWVASATNFDPNQPNAPGPYYPFEFRMQKNILYRGKTEVKNGEFSFTFLVPKDISFAPGPGKISYYATDGISDGQGFHNKLVVGGESGNVYPDTEGPSVKIYLNDKNFVSGGVTNENPIFYAELSDSSGINTSGTGLGHDLSVILDDNASKPVILNDYYEANLNSYQAGKVRYPLNKLSAGEHRLSFKVWDIQNNSNTVHSDFIVAESAELALEKVLNYPNPFTTRTEFMFQHNQACNPLKVIIQVYTVTGKLVKTITESVSCNGYKPEGVAWDGRDDFGSKLGRGVYIYRLSILDINNKKAEKIEKLVILN